MAAVAAVTAVELSPSPAAKMNDQQKLDLLANHDAFLFDCDGTLWKGPKLLDGVPELLKLLRAQNKMLFFVTNNATKTRAELVAKCVDKGFDVKMEEMYSSAYAAAVYLKSLGFKKNKKVYVLAESGVVDELRDMGFNVLGGPEDAGKKVDWSAAVPTVEVDPEVAAVVVGIDREINYYKIQYASKALLTLPGCVFVATNMDCRAHFTANEEWADSGPIIATIIAATEMEPVVVGKPSPIMIDAIRRVSGVPKPRMCIVGDRLETDILWGLQNGCTTVLVLSGVTSEAMLQAPTNAIKPKLVLDQVGDLLSVKDKLPTSCTVQ